MTAVRLSTLTENTAGHRFLLAERGLGILIEAPGMKLLLDTGRSVSAAHNADVLGIDLANVDYIVLSHGHLDHTGGLAQVLQRVHQAQVIAHPDIWMPRYVQEDEGYVELSCPCSRGELEALGAEFQLFREPVRLSDDIMTSGEVSMVTAFEQLDAKLFTMRDGELGPDPVPDDLALFIRTELGLVVLLGCAHRGLINTIFQAQRLTGDERVHAVIGGSHLFRATQEQVEQTVVELKRLGVQRLGLCHCTGFEASVRLWQEFGNSFFLNHTGTQISLP